VTARNTHSNVASRVGAWSASHRRAAIAGWLAFMVLALLAGQLTGMRMLSGSAKSGESASAQEILDRVGMPQTALESVLIQSKTTTVDTPAFRAAVASVRRAVAAQKYVSGVISPFDAGAEGLIAKDRRSALVQFRLEGSMMDQQPKRVAAPLAAVAKVSSENPGFRIEEFGQASFGKAALSSASSDFHRAELLSIPATIIILLLAFGALVAAVLPVVLALTAFVTALGLVLITSHAFPIDMSALSVMLLIGLAVGVDYSIFYIRREREERAAGATPEEALRAAAATSGRSVLISGLTVMVAVAGMFFAGTADFRGIAMGTILVVATSVIGSLTVLPALLSKLGDRIEKGRIPFLHREAKESGRFWSATVDTVLRHPLFSAVGATAVLVVCALPLFRMHTIQPGYADYPRTLPILQTFQRIEHAFPAGPAPAQVVVETRDTSSRQFAVAVRRFRTAALATGQAFDPLSVQALNKHVAVISLPLGGDGQNDRSTAALHTLRSQVIPETLAGRAGIDRVAVGGDTAWAADYNATMRSHIPIVFAFVLGLAFLLLLVTFRSIVIALKAIVLNLLSVGAAYGFIVAVFQWGWGEHILGFHSNHGITAWIPLFLFVVLFGLSMDYHVFILSRIREAVDRGATTEAAVAKSVKATAGVITSAAIVMVVVFSIFGSLSQVSMKEIGTGLAFAVLLDATIVRGVLLPATMKLLGERNWWLPKKLSWLPQLELEGSVADGKAIA
jgi:RND superfamily putative drug exporter